MKTKSLLAIGAAFMVAITAQGQSTNSSWAGQLYGDVKTFFTDNTNIFNASAVQLEIGPVVNVSNGRFGADADVQFPIAQQASVGFDLLYYNGQVYDGAFNTTLGTTWTIPYINQPVYTYGQAGIGTDLQNAQTLINEEWVGAKTQWIVGKNIIKSGDSIKVGANLAYGHISNESGTLLKAMISGEWDF